MVGGSSVGLGARSSESPTFTPETQIFSDLPLPKSQTQTPPSKPKDKGPAL